MKKSKYAIIVSILCFGFTKISVATAATKDPADSSELQSACEFFKSNFEKSFDTCTTKKLIREKVSKLKNLDCKEYGASLIENIDFLAGIPPYNFDVTCFQGGKFQNTPLEKAVLVNTLNLDPKAFGLLVSSSPNARSSFMKLDRSQIADHLFEIAVLFPENSSEKKALLTEVFYQLQGRIRKASDTNESVNKKLDYIADHGGPKRSDWRPETEACYLIKPKLAQIFGNCASNPPFRKSFLNLNASDCQQFPKLFMNDMKDLSSDSNENDNKACVDSETHVPLAKSILQKAYHSDSVSFVQLATATNELRTMFLKLPYAELQENLFEFAKHFPAKSAGKTKLLKKFVEILEATDKLWSTREEKEEIVEYFKLNREYQPQKWVKVGSMAVPNACEGAFTFSKVYIPIEKYPDFKKDKLAVELLKVSALGEKADSAKNQQEEFTRKDLLTIRRKFDTETIREWVKSQKLNKYQNIFEHSLVDSVSQKNQEKEDAVTSGEGSSFQAMNGVTPDFLALARLVKASLKDFSFELSQYERKCESTL